MSAFSFIPWGKRLGSSVFPKPDSKPTNSRMIEFKAEDDFAKRASNIWYTLGFGNDHIGAINKIAGLLAMYSELDQGKVPCFRPGLYDIGPRNKGGKTEDA